jgi:predicted unusual protein kinase regulating ubiquinone biosynthesis (AarF/ABC1/UbiB family)
VWRLTAGTRGGSPPTAPCAGSRTNRPSALDDAFALRTAEDVARELGNMKGALMKAGQLLSFIVEALPEPAQQALSSLYSDAPPMSAELAAGVVLEEFGATPERVFLDWTPVPVAAASVGQVHRAITRRGEDVAVKVQYPGVADAIEADLANAEGLYRLFSAMAMKGLDTKALVNELRSRMREELDYRIEASNVTEFRAHFEGHPFVSMPALVPEHSGRRVLTTEWVDGLSWTEFRDVASPEALQRAGESIWRFAQHAILRIGAFNGDPHPGNYKFTRDGDVTFLDFGLVKRWSPGEWELLRPSMEAIILHREPELLVTTMEASGFLRPGHGLDPAIVFEYVSTPYRPYLTTRSRSPASS